MAIPATDSHGQAAIMSSYDNSYNSAKTPGELSAPCCVNWWIEPQISHKIRDCLGNRLYAEGQRGALRQNGLGCLPLATVVEDRQTGAREANP